MASAVKSGRGRVLPAAFSGRVDSPRQLPPGGTFSPMLEYLTHVEASGVGRLCGVLCEEKTETLLKPRVPCCRGHLYNRRALKNPHVLDLTSIVIMK